MRAMDIICSQCKERIPEGSLACRYCGTVVTKPGGASPPVAEADSAKKRSLAGKLWISIVIVLVLAVVLALILR
ncbi:hypothetical protein D3C75_652630 [compost metagenome]